MDKYGVYGGYENGLEDDDSEGSRAVPCRTSLGSEATFIEKFPCYGGFRHGIRNFAYRCQLSVPEIELMMADLPHTLYKPSRKGKPTQKDVDEATRMALEAMEKKKRKREAEEVTIEDIFRK